jgi:hypothetical protein
LVTSSSSRPATPSWKSSSFQRRPSVAAVIEPPETLETRAARS